MIIFSIFLFNGGFSTNFLIILKYLENYGERILVRIIFYFIVSKTMLVCHFIIKTYSK